MNRRITGMIAILLAMGVGHSSMAVTLEDYGVEITSSGLVDKTNGLRWLDADLTMGTSATVNGLLENGWRIATGNELSYLLTRNSFNNDRVSVADLGHFARYGLGCLSNRRQTNQRDHCDGECSFRNEPAEIRVVRSESCGDMRTLKPF